MPPHRMMPPLLPAVHPSCAPSLIGPQIQNWICFTLTMAPLMGMALIYLGPCMLQPRLSSIRRRSVLVFHGP